MRNIDCKLIICPMTGWDDECGDSGLIITDEHSCFFALIDILGHGKEAHELTCKAKDYVLKHSNLHPVDIIKKLHVFLHNSRGAVAAAGRIDLASGEVVCAGMGNISARIFGGDPTKIIFKEGIIGHVITTVNEHRATLHPGDILILTSDGIKEHYDIDDHPGILIGSATQIASDFIHKLGKHDDAACLVMRYGV